MAGVINIRIPDTTIGLGAISTLGDTAKGFGPTKILIITDRNLIKAGVVDAVKAPLEKAGLKFDIYDGCKEKPPISVVEEVAQKIRTGNYDLLIGVGGGSNMDTTKSASILAFSGMSTHDYLNTWFHDKIEGKIIPKILVPTTGGTGSEWSIGVAVYEDAPSKRVYIVHAWENLPNKVIMDPELTLTVPQKVTTDAGIDAFTHAIEAYTSCTANVFSDMLASTAIKLIAGSIRLAYAKGCQSPEARFNMSIGAALAMNAVTTGGIGLVHFMNEFLGPKAGISHGAAVGILLPAVMEYNSMAVPEKFASIAGLMGENIDGLSVMDAAAKSVEAVRRLIKDLDLPQTMGEVGITEADISELAKECYEIDRVPIEALNPRDANEQDIARIFRAAL